MKIVFDLDGTLCEERQTFERSLAEPIQENINRVIEAKKAGHTIIIYSSRGWQEYRMTIFWLNSHNVPYDMLILGKPMYDLWVDDKAIKPEDLKRL